MPLATDISNAGHEDFILSTIAQKDADWIMGVTSKGDKKEILNNLAYLVKF